jgi:hypothetical protein
MSSSVVAAAPSNCVRFPALPPARPGSWEADGVRQLLTSTVGYDEEYLPEHRTEPLVVDLYVDEILFDLGAWQAYDDANQETPAATRHTASPPGSGQRTSASWSR